jgi:plasmid stabilization system protein ParE
MVFRVEFSEDAENEVDDIIRYISDELDNPWAAERFYEKVMLKSINISHNPYGYPLSREEKLFEKGYRYVVVGNYIMLYTVEEEKSLATVKNVVYGKRNLGLII